MGRAAGHSKQARDEGGRRLNILPCTVTPRPPRTLITPAPDNRNCRPSRCDRGGAIHGATGGVISPHCEEQGREQWYDVILSQRAPLRFLTEPRVMLNPSLRRDSG
ncbi:hypothetical protein E2C01_049936 [Portunus trituberculatus]|uniref:Uncharacterized protein n=1 Tax=Portunus trituberculatus TaxID=210409 RepID=A0A5B7GFA9_PORTR|nr:hypothetical protein [Portunus trituberculatus]